MGEIIIAAAIIVIVGGLIYYLLSTVPIIPSPFKEWGLWVVVAVAAICLVLYVIIPLIRLAVGAF